MPSADRNNVKAIIFDFDGTIADSAEIFIESLGELLKKPGFSDEEAKALSHMNLHQIGRELHIKKWQLPLITYKGRKKILTKMDRVKLFKNMSSVIKELADEYDLYILSSNSKPAIERFLDKHYLSLCFKRLYAGTSLTAKSKRLKKLLRIEKLETSQCVYIGDEVRDIEAAHKIGMRCIAVSWGYNSKKALLAMSPDKFIDKPSQLIKAVSNLN